MKFVQSCLPGALLIALGASSCVGGATSTPRNADVIELVRSARFEKAVNTAQVILDRDPENPVARRNLRDAQIAYLISSGRKLTFEGRIEEGLEYFYRAQALDESNEVVRDWINKTRIQLAEDTLTLAGTLSSREELAERKELLEHVLNYLPEDEDSQRVKNLRLLASSSLERVERTLDYCRSRGRDCFEEGMGSLARSRYHEAWHDFSAALLHDKTQEEAIHRLRRVGALVGEELLAQAQEYENLGLFDAARMEYERVHQKDPGNQVAIEGLNRMEREVRVGRLLDEAEMAMLRGTPEEAEEFLVEAEELTLVQLALVDDMRLAMRNARWEAMYQRALALEIEGSLPQAVEAFDELLLEAEDYEDTQVRKEVLEEFIAKAAGLYARAAETEDRAVEYALLREIQIFWPSYLDVRERLEAMQAQSPAEKPQGGKL